MTKKKRVAIIASVCILLIAAVGLVCLQGKRYNHGNSGSPEAKMYAAKALNVVKSLDSGDYKDAIKDFTANAKEDIDPRQFGDEWLQIEKTWGPFKSCEILNAEDEYEERDVAYSVCITCRFEKGTMRTVVDFGPQKQISYVNFEGKPENPDETKMYADKAINVIKSFEARDYENLVRDYEPRLQKMCNPQQMVQGWSEVTKQFGQLNSYKITDSEDKYEHGLVHVVYMDCKFEKGKMYMVVGFDAQKKICSMCMSDKPQR
ncbi:MAG: DUF3887 domain-containing protein [Armatimonadota bacterium]